MKTSHPLHLHSFATFTASRNFIFRMGDAPSTSADNYQKKMDAAAGKIEEDVRLQKPVDAAVREAQVKIAEISDATIKNDPNLRGDVLRYAEMTRRAIKENMLQYQILAGIASTEAKLNTYKMNGESIWKDPSIKNMAELQNAARILSSYGQEWQNKATPDDLESQRSKLVVDLNFTALRFKGEADGIQSHYKDMAKGPDFVAGLENLQKEAGKITLTQLNALQNTAAIFRQTAAETRRLAPNNSDFIGFLEENANKVDAALKVFSPEVQRVQNGLTEFMNDAYAVKQKIKPKDGGRITTNAHELRSDLGRLQLRKGQLMDNASFPIGLVAARDEVVAALDKTIGLLQTTLKNMGEAEKVEADSTNATATAEQAPADKKLDTGADVNAFRTWLNKQQAQIEGYQQEVIDLDPSSARGSQRLRNLEKNIRAGITKLQHDPSFPISLKEGRDKVLTLAHEVLDTIQKKLADNPREQLLKAYRTSLDDTAKKINVYESAVNRADIDKVSNLDQDFKDLEIIAKKLETGIAGLTNDPKFPEELTSGRIIILGRANSVLAKAQQKIAAIRNKKRPLI